MLILGKNYVYQIKKNRCPNCGSNSVIHFGKQNDRIRFQCKICLKVFQPKDNSWIDQAYEDYTIHKQTFAELELKYNKSEKTIRKHFDQIKAEFKPLIFQDQEINLTFDTTFFKRRFGCMIYRSSGKNLKCSFVPSEKLGYYLGDLFELSKEYVFQSFTIDGRRGLIQLLQKHYPSTPIQICHFHQVAIVTRYITRKPKTECGKELKSLILKLKSITREGFTIEFKELQLKHQDYLKEKNEQGQFQHRQLRSAIRSIKSNLPYLFTFQDNSNLKIPPTTNSCDGSFGQWKYKVKLHRGISDERMQQMIRRLLNCP